MTAQPRRFDPAPLLQALLISTTLAGSLVISLPVHGWAGPKDDSPATARADPTDGAPAPLFDLKNYPDRVVVLDFWASWCAPCKRSFPWLTEMDEKYRKDGLVIVAVDVDRNPRSASAFLAEMKPGFQILQDAQGALAATYKLQAMPSSFIYDRSGNLRKTHVGFQSSDREALEQELVALLQEAPRDSARP